MYENPSRWGLTFQTYAQLTLVDLHKRASAHPAKMMERSVYSAR
jgi:thymidine kinase